MHKTFNGSTPAAPDASQEIGEEHHDELDVTKSEMCWRRETRQKSTLKAAKALLPVITPAYPAPC